MAANGVELLDHLFAASQLGQFDRAYCILLILFSHAPALSKRFRIHINTSRHLQKQYRIPELFLSPANENNLESALASLNNAFSAPSLLSHLTRCLNEALRQGHLAIAMTIVDFFGSPEILPWPAILEVYSTGRFAICRWVLSLTWSTRYCKPKKIRAFERLRREFLENVLLNQKECVKKSISMDESVSCGSADLTSDGEVNRLNLAERSLFWDEIYGNFLSGAESDSGSNARDGESSEKTDNPFTFESRLVFLIAFDAEARKKECPRGAEESEGQLGKEPNLQPKQIGTDDSSTLIDRLETLLTRHFSHAGRLPVSLSSDDTLEWLWLVASSALSFNRLGLLQHVISGIEGKPETGLFRTSKLKGTFLIVTDVICISFSFSPARFWAPVSSAMASYSRV